MDVGNEYTLKKKKKNENQIHCPFLKVRDFNATKEGKMKFFHFRRFQLLYPVDKTT